jgi:hypothetical protein
MSEDYTPEFKDGYYLDENGEPIRGSTTYPLPPVKQEEEAWTEEYFAKQDCGEVVGTPPTYQWIIMTHDQFPIGHDFPLATFCKEGYAKLFKQWLEKLNPDSRFGIIKVINNPQKPKELQTK